MSFQPYEGLKLQDLRRLKDMLIVETADMLQAPLFTAEALLRAHGVYLPLSGKADIHETFTNSYSTIIVKAILTNIDIHFPLNMCVIEMHT